MKSHFKYTFYLLILLFIGSKCSAQASLTPLNLTVTEECGEKIIISVSYPYSIPSTIRLDVYLYIERKSNNPGNVINEQLIGSLTLNNPVVKYTYTLTGGWNSEYCVKVKHKIINIQNNTQTWASVFSATKCLTLTLCNPNGIPGPPSLTLPPPNVVASNIVCKSFRVNWGSTCPAKDANIEVRTSGTNVLVANINVSWGLLGYTFDNKDNNLIVPGGTYTFRVRIFYNCSLSVSAQGWTPWSNSQTVTLPNNPPNAGPDKTIPPVSCTSPGNGVQLQATPIAGGKWSLVSANPANYVNYGQIYNNTDPNAYFTFNSNHGATSYTLKWENECGFDLMTVYTSFVCGTDVTDTRDSKVYSTRLYASKCWFTKNLNFGTQINWVGGHPSLYTTASDASWPASNSNIVKYCLKNNTSNCTAYGGLYLGDVAALSELCPCGWHVATDAEWTSLANFASILGDAATVLKGSQIGFNALKTNSSVAGTHPDGNLTTGFLNDIYLTRNSFGIGFSGVYFYLTGQPKNSLNANGGFDYTSSGQYTNYWTSTPNLTTGGSNPYPSRYGGTSSGYAYFRTFIGEGAITNTPTSKNPFKDELIVDNTKRRAFAFHVRCVKN